MRIVVPLVLFACVAADFDARDSKCAAYRPLRQSGCECCCAAALASAASARACVQFNEPDVAYSWQVSYRLAETYPKRCY